MISSAMSTPPRPFVYESEEAQFFESKFFSNTELCENTDDEFEPLPSKSRQAQGERLYSASSDCADGSLRATHSSIKLGENSARGIPAEWEAGSRRASNHSSPVNIHATDDVIKSQPPTTRLSAPPGTWFPTQRGGAEGVSARAEAQPPTEGPLRLVEAVHAPPPLHHNKAHLVTSLTVNAIPFSILRNQLCTLLDQTGFAGRYDYVYMPCNRDKTNRGHAFINFCSPEDARVFFATWHGARVVGASSHPPVLSVSVSVVQGFESSVQRWTVAKLLGVSDPDFRPFIAGMSS